MADAPELVLQPTCPLGGRASHDHYPTPPGAVLPLVRYAQRARWWATGEAVLDPCCGEGKLLDALRDFAGLVGHGIELDPARAELARRRGHQVREGDALVVPWAARGTGLEEAPLVVSNPPFSHAEDFVRAALLRMPPRGLVAMLLPMNFIETPGRARLHRACPADIFVLAKRPSFDGKGTAAIPYAWWVWGREGGGWEVLEDS